MTMKLFTLFLDALKKFPQSLEPVFAPVYARFIHQLVTFATESEVQTSIKLSSNSYFPALCFYWASITFWPFHGSSYKKRHKMFSLWNHLVTALISPLHT